MMASNIITPTAIVATIYFGTLGIEAALPTGPTQASLESLEYENGVFRQEFRITGDRFLDMNWTAEINRGARSLCSGGGRAPYRDATPKEFDADEWTFDDCPPLRPGDEAFAVWSYIDGEGLKRRFDARLILTEEMLGM